MKNYLVFLLIFLTFFLIIPQVNSSSNETLKIMTYNIAGWNIGNRNYAVSKEVWLDVDETIDNIVELLEKYNVDIVAFQEVWKGKDELTNKNIDLYQLLSNKLSKVGYIYSTNLGSRSFNNGNATQAIFSKYPISNNEELYIEPVCSVDNPTVCYYNYAPKSVIDFQSFKLYFFNVHFSASGGEIPCNQLNYFIDNHLKNYLNYISIILGDYNVKYGTGTCSTKLQKTHQDSCATSGNSSCGDSVVSPSNNVRIDQLYYSKNLNSCLTLKDSFVINVDKEVNYHISDHFPVFAEFELKKTIIEVCDGLDNDYDGLIDEDLGNVIPVPADYDGDGKTDMASFDSFAGNWFIRKSSDLELIKIAFGHRNGVPVPSDYDGDGKTDLATWNKTTFEWLIKNSSNNQTINMFFGWSTVVPVPGDYDGDGKTDLAVWASTKSEWYIRNSATSKTVIIPFGWSTVLPVPGDYDGDGKTDLGVWNKNDTNWYIKNSSNNLTTTKKFGWSEAILVPGDYDGDGKVEIGVYSKRMGEWYIDKFVSTKKYSKILNSEICDGLDNDCDGLIDEEFDCVKDSSGCNANCTFDVSYYWVTSGWSSCSGGDCSGGGSKTRTVQCKNNLGAVVADSFCTTTKPSLSEPCTAISCNDTQSCYQGNCVINCTINNWEPVNGNCQSSGNLTRTWSKVGACVNGTPQPVPETIPCTYQVPNCIYEYSDWSECISGTQTKTATATNQPCNGNPEQTTQLCTPQCKETDYNYNLDPEKCPENETQTKRYYKTGNCAEGTPQPVDENITCKYLTMDIDEDTNSEDTEDIEYIEDKIIEEEGVENEDLTVIKPEDSNSIEEETILDEINENIQNNYKVTPNVVCNEIICNNICQTGKGICCNNNWNSDLNSCEYNYDKEIDLINSLEDNEATELIQKAIDYADNGELKKANTYKNLAEVKAKIIILGNKIEQLEKYEQALLAAQNENYEQAELIITEMNLPEIQTEENIIGQYLIPVLIVLVIVVIVILVFFRKNNVD